MVTRERLCASGGRSSQSGATPCSSASRWRWRVMRLLEASDDRRRVKFWSVLSVIAPDCAERRPYISCSRDHTNVTAVITINITYNKTTQRRTYITSFIK